MASKKKAAKPRGIVDDITKGVGKALESNSITSSVVRDVKAFQSGGVKGVIKAAAKDAAVSAASMGVFKGGASVGKIVGSKVGKSIGTKIGNAYFDDAVLAVEKSKGGGRVFRTNTPMGPSLGSTKIMNAKQLEAAKTGLRTIVSNQADLAEAKAAAEIANVVSGAVRATSKGAAAATYAAGKSSTSKPKSKSKARRNVR